MKAAFLSHPMDNVATLLEDASAEPVRLVGAPDSAPLVARGDIPRAHKVALRTIAAGEPVVKYGVAIGIATRAIGPGEWVHLHNCRSQMDERSSNFAGGLEKGWEKKYA